MMKYTKYQNQLPREHRNTPWAENDPVFRMQPWEKVFWALLTGFFVTIVALNPFGWGAW